MKQYFLPGGDPKKLLWIINFGKKLPAYKDKYNLSNTEVEDIQKGSAFFNFLLSFLSVFSDFFQKLTAYKNESRDGTKDGQAAGVLPPVPDPGPVPDVPEPGIFKRATSLANVIKKKANYTISDGEDLGIEGPEMEEADEVNDKPLISLLLVQGGHVQVKWAKKRFDGIDIYVDRGDGNWVFLATDTIPDYVDTHTLPDAGKSALWRYKAIYRMGDQQVAQWSDVVSITVGTAL
jgi:hypothetical protein